jgi:uncharacterized protein involved in exopolysaccharide biosynthesis
LAAGKDPAKARAYADAVQSTGPEAINREYEQLKIARSTIVVNEATMRARGIGTNNKGITTSGAALAELDKQIDAQAQRFVQGHIEQIRQRLEAAVERPDTVRKEFATQQKQSVELSAKLAELAQLDAVVEQGRRELERLNQRIMDL